MHLLLAAGVQAVKVINSPLPVHVTDVTDPVIVKTYFATVVGIGIATLAAGIALYDVIRNTNQIRDFTRRPEFKIEYWAVRGTTTRDTDTGRQFLPHVQ